MLVTLLSLALPLGSLHAQPDQKTPGAAPSDGKPRKERAEKMKERSEHMKKELALTDEQAEKIAAIHKQDMAAMRLLKEDQGLSKEDRKSKIMEIRKASDQKINGLLTTEQNAKRDLMKKEMKEKKQDKKDPQS